MNTENTLARLIEESVRESVTDNVGILFSGGIDSSLIAYLASKYSRVTAYTVGSESSHDLAAAKSSADLLNLNLKIIKIDEKSVYDGIKSMLLLNLSQDALEISYELPLYFISKFAEQKVLLSGQGSDEMFGGYKKYKTNSDTMLEDLNRVVNLTYLRENRIASTFEKELRAPYLSDKLIEFSKTLELSEKLNDKEEKIILRKAARILGLPEEITTRKKKAAQYGSGIIKILNKLAKSNGMEVYQYINDLKSKI